MLKGQSFEPDSPPCLCVNVGVCADRTADGGEGF